MVDVTERSTNELGLLARWRYVLRTTNPPEGKVDVVSKWLVLTRAAVLPMTVTAGAIAGLIAVHQPGFNWGWYLLALLGIVLAHAANNLMNDLFDLEVGLDTVEYPRGLYAPHPVLSGMISRKGLGIASLVVNIADLAILVILTAARGWPVVAFAVSGFLLSAAYTAPPLRLKKRGLGEPDVLVVWGPLMVGGTYYSAVGHLPWQVTAASLPYGLLCTAVLMGKHVDKLPWDAKEGIRTLPVILGDARARRATQLLMAAFYAAVVIDVAAGALPWPSVIAIGALPAAVQAWRALAQPKPDTPPADFPIWPLWFAAFAFLHTRRAGALLVLGLIVAAVVDITPF
jgi:1,4-dihydroxy-2-naphthoate polyprenyltransferase